MTTRLVELATAGDLAGVAAAYKQAPPEDVKAAAEVLREADAYKVAIELYAWLLASGAGQSDRCRATSSKIRARESFVHRAQGSELAGCCRAPVSSSRRGEDPAAALP